MPDETTTLYHVFTDNADEWYEDEREAITAYDRLITANNNARLYVDIQDEADETIKEDCLMSFSDYPS